MLHMYRDVKKTTYTQTKKLTHPHKNNHKHTQTNKTPSTCVCAKWFRFSGARKWAATFSLVAPSCPREDTLRGVPGGRNRSTQNKNKKNKCVREGWETINGKDAVFFCNKKTSKWKIKNELKIVQKEDTFYKKSSKRKK